MNILTADNITKAYGERRLLDGASFFLQEGEKVGIIGINGTGKSTLLKILAGMEEPDEGKVIRAQGMVVRFLPQHPSFRPEDTLIEALLRENGKTEEEATDLITDAKNMMTRLGITDFNETCGHLSGGQKKRLALISVLLTPSDLLILDEPTNHLDITYQLELMDIVQGLGRTVVAAIHDLNIAAMYCTRLFVMEKGQLVASGTPEEVLTPELIRQIYGVKAKVFRDEAGILRIQYYPEGRK